MKNILRYIIKMICITCDTSIAHNTTWWLIVETWKTAPYDTHAVLYHISCTNTHINWYITPLSCNIHIKYVVKKFRLLSVYMLYRYKTIWHYTTYNIKLVSFKNTYILYKHHVMFFYHTQINCIITIQISQNCLFVDVSIYPCIDIELCGHCFALPCECVPINIVMKEGNGKSKHFKNLMKENEICTMKCIDKVWHNDQSWMLMHFMCIM